MAIFSERIPKEREYCLQLCGGVMQRGRGGLREGRLGFIGFLMTSSSHGLGASNLRCHKIELKSESGVDTTLALEVPSYMLRLAGSRELSWNANGMIYHFEQINPCDQRRQSQTDRTARVASSAE